MIQQASSIMGRVCTLDEAEDLAKRVDFQTRGPVQAKPEAVRPRWLRMVRSFLLWEHL